MLSGLLRGVSRVAPRAAVASSAGPGLGWAWSVRRQPAAPGWDVQDGERPAPAVELAGDRDVRDYRPLLSLGQLLPAGVQALVAGVPAGPGGGFCLVPAAPQDQRRAVGLAVVPGGLDWSPPGVAVPALGDRALAAAGAGGGLGRDQPEERGEAAAGEPGPVPDLHRQPERGQHRHAAQALQPAGQRRPRRVGRELPDGAVEPVAPVGRQQHRVQRAVVGQL